MRAIQRAQIAGHIGLSPRELECLKWLASGQRNDRIADRMGVTRPTAEMHLANARRKLGAATREHALARALMLGLIDVYPETPALTRHTMEIHSWRAIA